MLEHIIKLFSKKDYREFLLDSLPKNSIGCELGVWKGEFSKHIIEIVKPKKLYLVDPWLYQPKFTGSWYGGTVAKNQNDMDHIHDSVVKEFAGKNNIEIVRSKTDALIDYLEDACLDWVYIDGNHEYSHVVKDLEIFMTKVRSNGIICGDDYGRGGPGIGPVAKAVKTFVNNNECELAWVKKNQFCIKK